MAGVRILKAADLTAAQREEAADLVTSYVMGAEKAMQELGIDQETLDEVLLGMNVEQCPNCGWYDDCYAMLPDGQDEPDGQCSNCR